jgi:hypothetical protein
MNKEKLKSLLMLYHYMTYIPQNSFLCLKSPPFFLNGASEKLKQSLPSSSILEIQ